MGRWEVLEMAPGHGCDSCWVAPTSRLSSDRRWRGTHPAGDPRLCFQKPGKWKGQAHILEFKCLHVSVVLGGVMGCAGICILTASCLAQERAPCFGGEAPHALPGLLERLGERGCLPASWCLTAQ